jgi:hypothetical protein
MKYLIVVLLLVASVFGTEDDTTETNLFKFHFSDIIHPGACGENEAYESAINSFNDFINNPSIVSNFDDVVASPFSYSYNGHPVADNGLAFKEMAQTRDAVFWTSKVKKVAMYVNGQQVAYIGARQVAGRDILL